MNAWAAVAVLCLLAGRAIAASSALETLLLVGLLDGRLAGVDSERGNLRWIFDSGSPLLASSDALADENILPSPDGSLYAISRGDSRTAHRLHVSLPYLASAPPSLTADGSILHGASSSSSFALDPSSGSLRSSRSTTSASSSVTHSNHSTLQGSLLIGRQDWFLYALDAHSGTCTWNASYGMLFPRYAPESGSLSSSAFTGFVSKLHTDNSRFALSWDGSLRKVDRDGNDLWRLSFSTLPLQLTDALGNAVTSDSPSSASSASSKLDDNMDLLPDQRIRIAFSSGGYCALPESQYSSGPQQLPPGSHSNRPALMPSLEPSSASNLSLSQRIDVFSRTQPTKLPQTLQEYLLLLLTSPLGSGIITLCIAAMFRILLGLRKGSLQSTRKASRAKISSNEDTQQQQQQQQSLSSNLNKEVQLREAIPIDRVKSEPDDQSADCCQASTSSFLSEACNSSSCISNGNTAAYSSVHDHCFSEDGDDRRFSNISTSSSSLVRCASTERSDTHVQHLEHGWSQIDSLLVGPEVLGKGSCGTVVFEGIFHRRPVAVKRLVSEYHKLAENEVDALIHSDSHPNVVRHFAIERTQHFIYLALQRCERTLADVVAGNAVSETGASELFDCQNRPSSFSLSILHDVAAGLSYLHEQGISHRDLKPSNVLITEDCRAKLADMGLCRYLTGDESFASDGTLGGTSGWQAPERLRHGRQTRAVDLFALGLIIFYTTTGGLHPFGEQAVRDANTLSGNDDLSAMSHLPEARHLLRSLLASDPHERPSAKAVLLHLLWWGPERRLAFLVDVSDRMEMEDREGDDTLFRLFESGSAFALNGSWTDALSSGLMENLGRYRKYHANSVRDLLRIIRNKRHHFSELPLALQRELGSLPNGFLQYFTSRFPRLLLYAFCFAREHFAEEVVFRKYFTEGHATSPDAALITLDPSIDSNKSAPKVPVEETFSRAWSEITAKKQPQAHQVFPRRPGQKQCDFYMKTGRCKFGSRCVFDHPPNSIPSHTNEQQHLSPPPKSP